MISRGELKTEQQNLKSLQIDSSSIVEILSTINEEDKGVADAVEKAIPEIEKVVSFCVNSIKNGGRVFYIGAGTSGRQVVCVLDGQFGDLDGLGHCALLVVDVFDGTRTSESLR